MDASGYKLDDSELTNFTVTVSPTEAEEGGCCVQSPNSFFHPGKSKKTGGTMVINLSDRSGGEGPSSMGSSCNLHHRY